MWSYEITMCNVQIGEPYKGRFLCNVGNAGDDLYASIVMNEQDLQPDESLRIQNSIFETTGTVDPEPVSTLGGLHTTAFQIEHLQYRLTSDYNTIDDFWPLDEGGGDPNSEQGKAMSLIATVDPWTGTLFPQRLALYTYNRNTGDKRYELANHLGNVLSVVSDKKIPKLAGSSLQYFNPDVKAYNDYYPFGMLIPGRHANTGDYRYGFNNMELDNEIKGEGNSYDFGARMYDPRVARWFAVDPDASKYPSWSPYAFSLNDPLRFRDPDGKNPDDVIEKSLKDLKEREGYEIYVDRVTAETIIIKTEVIFDYTNISKEGNRVEYNLRKTNIKLDENGHVINIIITDNLVKAEVKETTRFGFLFAYELIENQKGKETFVKGITPNFNSKEEIDNIISESPIVTSFSNLINKQTERVISGDKLPYKESTTEENVKGIINTFFTIVELVYLPPTPYSEENLILPTYENEGNIKFFIPKDEENKAVKIFDKESQKSRIEIYH